ncbi:DYNC1LI [Lepeophtheirus salmonis]|uniref:DYNC1LI n=1 Tax=Lepeophtheirus salmonis TaxID=72036 RepID=A0A7R8H3R4_LEPSM|nr:DYNC1LI [Lepeophtheirus salmonis]CAF2835906.1 DYNC1LI [Lepeophtheirus salmonis]
MSRILTPLQLRIRRQNVRKMASIPFDSVCRDMIHVNALSFGSPGSGKSTLNSKLTQISSDKYGRVPYKSVNDIDRKEAHLDKKKSMARGSKNATHLEWDTSKIRVAHTDVPTASLRCNLVIKHMASNNSYLNVIPFISNNPNPEDLELIKMDLKEILTKNECNRILSDPHQIPDLMDNIFESKQRKTGGSLLWPLENVGNIPSKGTFIAGRLMQGSVKDLETVTAFYRGNSSPVTIRSCEIFKRPCGYLLSQERGGAYIRIKHESSLELKKGGVLYKTGDSEMCIGSRWEVKLSCDQHKVLKGSQSTVLIHRTLYDGSCRIDENEIQLSPEKSVCSKIVLSYPIVARKDDPFLIKLPNFYVYGVFMNILD